MANKRLLRTIAYGGIAAALGLGAGAAWLMTVPKGGSLTIDWTDKAALNEADWNDPRTWESYRNFWGFDPPRVKEDGTWPYRARLDNWGTPLQMHENEALVVSYGKRVGFRPSPAQLKRFLSLADRLRTARLDGGKESGLRQELSALIKSAQGELPSPESYRIEFYGDPYHESRPTPPEVLKKQNAAAVLDLYRRLGIEHLYELYEIADDAGRWREIRRMTGVW